MSVGKFLKPEMLGLLTKFTDKITEDNTEPVQNHIFPGTFHESEIADEEITADEVPDIIAPVDIAPVADYDENRSYPMRIRNIPSHLDDYICVSVDYCCTIKNYVIPKSYEEAVVSPESTMRKTAMDSEIDS